MCVNRWALSTSPDSRLTAKALIRAYESRGKPEGILFHSDQESHYTSIHFRQHLWRYRMEQGLSRRGHCGDNAPMGRFFRSLKSEWGQEIRYRSLDEAELASCDQEAKGQNSGQETETV